MAHMTDVLKKPVLTEKSLALQTEENKYTFDVDLNANKTEVKIAVEKLFNVKVEKVNIMNVKPKAKRMGRYEGKTNKRRKAIVKLAEGSTINYFDLLRLLYRFPDAESIGDWSNCWFQSGFPCEKSTESRKNSENNYQKK